MRILVAGGAGYVGSLLVPRLLELGHQVTVADLLWFGNHLPPEARLLERNVLSLTEQEVAGHEQVVFLAGVSNDPMAEYSPAKNFVYNGAAPAYLAYLAHRVGVARYVYGSSCSIYGYSADALRTEEDPTVCHYPYGISKLQGERACLQLADDDFSVISLRKGTVSGWSPRMRLDLIVNTMFRCAMADRRIVVRNPAIWRPVLAIRDAVEAYVRAVEAPADVTGTFNLASGNYTVGDVGRRVKAAVEGRSGEPVELEIRDEEELRSYRVSTDKAERVLGFRPGHDIESIVDELFTHAELFRDFDNPGYYNIETFVELERDLPVDVTT